jgi:hypothetical protein
MRSRTSAAFSNSSASAGHHLRLQVADHLLLLAQQEALGIAHVAA